MEKKKQDRQLDKNKSEAQDRIRAGKEELMEAMTAACALIAFADGSLDIKERQRMFALFQSNPSFRGFSHADIDIEFSRHKLAFELDPATARREAFMTIKLLKGTASELRLVLDTCRRILEADGIAHPQEHATLTEIRAILRNSLVKKVAEDLSSANWAEGCQKIRAIGERHA